MDAEAQPVAIVNPWTAIWWKPQAAINAVVQRAGKSYTLVLAALMIPAENIFARASIIYFSNGELRDTTSPVHAFDNIRWDRLLTTPK